MCDKTADVQLYCVLHTPSSTSPDLWLPTHHRYPNLTLHASPPSPVSTRLKYQCCWCATPDSLYAGHVCVQ